MMDPGKQLETESENDREASSCGSPVPGTACPLDISSENDKDIGDGQPEDMDAGPPAQSSNAMATFHGSRSASHIGRKPAFGQTCSMKTLLQDGILQTGEKVLTLEYEGQKFFGDLRRDGTIMMRGPDDSPHIYATPVAWANHCCKMLNPESKPLNAWSSIRFRGKRLDSYKLKWYRAQKAQKKPNNNNSNMVDNNRAGIVNIPGINMNPKTSAEISESLRKLKQHYGIEQQGSSRLMIHNPITNYFPQYENPIKNKKLIKSVLISNNMDNDCKKLVAKSLDLTMDPCVLAPRINNCGDDNNNDDNSASVNYCTNLTTTVINYEQLGTRGPHNTHDPNTMVKCIPFSTVDRIQPFNVTVSTNALLLVEFHSHLVNGEVAGYLAGCWDSGQHNLVVTQAFPCRSVLGDEATAASVEKEIRQDIENRNLTVVGWYHSHQGKYSNHPTIKDIQNQLDHQITMKESASGYTPCIGLICSPHDTRTPDDLSPSFQIYWVMPPPEHLTNHYGRPMQMYYSVTRDLFLTQDLLLEMRLLANYHTSRPSDMVDFKSSYAYNREITNLDKLSASIKPKLPKDLQESEYPDEPAIWKAAVDHFWKFLKNLVIVGSPDQQEEPQSQDNPDAESELGAGREVSSDVAADQEIDAQLDGEKNMEVKMSSIEQDPEHKSSPLEKSFSKIEPQISDEIEEVNDNIGSHSHMRIGQDGSEPEDSEQDIDSETKAEGEN